MGGVKRLISNRDLRYVYVGRMSISAHTSIVRKVFRLVRHAMAVNRCAEISFQNIGAGFHLSQGKRKGAPTIGNKVWIGPNATIVGKINVGNDVLIGANSYVNFDVPDHSIVLGNPGRIIRKENATQDYIIYELTEYR